MSERSTVDLFEARSKIGGRCDSHVIDYQAQRLTVDVGAQFFHPDTHPIYVTLLEQLGLYDPAHPDSGDTLEAPASLCIFPTAGGRRPSRRRTRSPRQAVRSILHIHTTRGNPQRMLNRSRAARVYRSTAVHALNHKRAGWFLETPGGTCGPYRFVVLNALPHVGRQLLRTLPGSAHLATLLRVYEYFDSRILIHTDPAYVQRDRRNWAVYNAGVRGRQCEGSVWYGAVHQKLPSGRTIDVFKSWADRRRADPKHILLERRFKHPPISRSTIQAARALGPLQGRDGLYFSGPYTTGFDSQESAVYRPTTPTRSPEP